MIRTLLLFGMNLKRKCVRISAFNTPSDQQAVSFTLNFAKQLKMPNLNLLKQMLIDKLKNYKLTNSIGMIQVTIEDSSENTALLAWLKGQTLYPHTFWQARNQQYTFATLGEIKRFDDLDQAQLFSQTSQFPLIGGLQFEGQSLFILPRLLISQSETNNQSILTAKLFINGENGETEKITCLKLLEHINHCATLNLTPTTLLHTEQAYQYPEWQQNVNNAIQQIHQQGFNKVVLANAKTLTFKQPISAYDLLAASRLKNLGCYHFLWAEDAENAFIGSSPERLYARDGHQFLTEALAGTASVGEDAAINEQNGQWLLHDEKNVYENWLVVEDICSHLAECTTEIDVSPIELKKLHNVQHLRRNICAILHKDINDSDCLQRIHPTAAVAGLPRLHAKQFIAETEPFKREWYAGTLGYFEPHKAEFCVTIRCAKIKQNQITLYAGAGIVEGSEPELEWYEIERKIQGIASILA